MERTYSFLSGDCHFIKASSLEEAKRLYSALMGNLFNGVTDEEIEAAEDGYEARTIVSEDGEHWEDLV